MFLATIGGVTYYFRGYAACFCRVSDSVVPIYHFSRIVTLENWMTNPLWGCGLFKFLLPFLFFFSFKVGFQLKLSFFFMQVFK